MCSLKFNLEIKLFEIIPFNDDCFYEGYYKKLLVKMIKLRFYQKDKTLNTGTG